MKKLSLSLLLLALPLVLASGAQAAKGKPRLSLSGVQISASSVDAGETLEVSGTIRNRGKRAAGGKGKLSVELRGGGLEDARIGSRALPRVKPGKKKSFRVEATVPANRAPVGPAESTGPYDVFACVRKQGTKGKRGCRRAGGELTITGANAGPEFTPGARTLGDPLFPQIGNGGYDALHYRIELDYDPATNSFAEGTATTITASATQNLSELSFDFQDDLVVSAVSVDGTPAGFDQVDATPDFSANPAVTQPKKLVVTPAAGIPEGTEFTVEVSYSGVPVEITDADESYEGWVRSCQLEGFTPPCDGAYTVNEPIGVQSWYPSNNYPRDKATFETVVTVPSTHVALGVGELEARTDNGDGTRTWDWIEDDQTAPFLTSATVGLFDYANSASFTEDLTGRNLPIYTAIDSAKNPTSKTAFATATGAIPTVMNFLADHYGPYPFDSTGAVTDVAPDVGYALENQTKPHYASGIDSNGAGFTASTQVHELSHQWFGDSVSPSTWQQIWFSEGWATFTENGYDPGGLDTVALEDFFDAIYAEPDVPEPLEDEWSIPPAELGGPENLFEVFPVYDRPGAMIEGFRQILGDDEAFFEFAAGLQETYGYATITEEEFVDAAKAASGFSGDDLALLDDYFQQWLHADSRPELTPDDFPPPAP